MSVRPRYALEALQADESTQSGDGLPQTLIPGVLRSADRRSGSRLLPARGDKKYLLQHFLHLLLPQSVPAA